MNRDLDLWFDQFPLASTKPFQQTGGKYPVYVSIYWAFFSWSSAFFIWRKLLRPRRLCRYFCTTTSFFLPLPHLSLSLSLSLSLIFILVCGLKWKKTDSFLRKAAFFSHFLFSLQLFLKCKLQVQRLVDWHGLASRALWLVDFQLACCKADGARPSLT